MKMREKLIIKKQSHDKIMWRSHEPSRLETFSDAVFAFALTLIVLSIEVPKSFDELAGLMKGTLSFGFCFLVLFMIWNTQNIFFRRFGLTDGRTVTLNGILMFVSLIYVYPMKFLTTLFVDSTYVEHGEVLPRMKTGQIADLMILYSAGYFVIYLLFFLMYKNAERHSTELELTPAELYETRTTSYINLINMAISATVIIAALIVPAHMAGMCGFIYFLIGPAYTICYSYRGKRSRLQFAD
ncbi:DUF1211 domain-containing protein [Mucilaginibacter sp. HMF5004]|uniref:TMEM175 family protein n=1 Tax=Mucilaginibacter rivuli TaxID=2857527 RepID=UPI001C5FDDAF|nr:TMEM175 family protein [Mucilaginibacter rivuli]MBW4890877.1 DUF1211 domain-containing protein [Mucilaginibacter rivuli]